MDQTRKYYEYIVIGCGGVGSAAVYWLSKRAGQGVLGLEQFKLGHENGASQDHSRIIRLAYEDEAYTKLTPDTYKTWEEVEKESGLQIVHKTGGIYMSKKDTHPELVEDFVEAMDTHKIEYEKMDGKELSRKFPQFTTDEKTVVVYEKDSGLVDAALGMAVHAQLARAHGATIIENCAVTRIWRDVSGRINVNASKGNFQCRRLIVAAGAWINDVLGTIGVHIPVDVTQEQVTYFGTPHVRDFTKNNFPVWIYFDKDWCYYGLPMHVNAGTKVGIDAGGPVVTASSRTFIPDKKREDMCIALLKEICPKYLGPILYTKTCLYTMTRDRNFLVDSCHHVGWPDVFVCQGAGHMYKFASLMGKILSEMAVDGKSNYDVSSFNITREAISDPNYKGLSGMENPKTTKTEKAKL